MTKLTSKIATAIAILGLAGPAFAATTSPSTASEPSNAKAQVQQRKHKKVAQADEKKAEKKADSKKAQKKHKSHAKSAKTTEAAPAPAAPAPATK